ncbi:hypothetical protein G7Y89_g9633 [Cudoniella acicularis]|uniref:Uncharacterized protein n=1 Tax=Cudoniella acicularis TaxID=354080 RepID=A0A8H4VZU7_9HELO|nr:hypothetical protein G7Y89_g9633 [Cudoniella acicularis]
MVTLTEHAKAHAAINHTEPELSLEISLQDVRMAMQDCGILYPEATLMDQEFGGEEDARGVDAFVAWAKGPGNKEIRRIALEGGDGAEEDYLSVLKKKHSTADEDSRYNGTILGRPAEPRAIRVEGGEATSLKEWAEKLKKPTKSTSLISSRRQSSALSSLGDEVMEDMEF